MGLLYIFSDKFYGDIWSIKHVLFLLLKGQTKMASILDGLDAALTQDETGLNTAEAIIAANHADLQFLKNAQAGGISQAEIQTRIDRVAKNTARLNAAIAVIKGDDTTSGGPGSLNAAPPSLSLSVSGNQTGQVSMVDAGFPGNVSAVMADPTIASVAPGGGPSGTTFTVTANGPGSTTLTFDDGGNTLEVPVTVTA